MLHDDDVSISYLILYFSHFFFGGGLCWIFDWNGRMWHFGVDSILDSLWRSDGRFLGKKQDPQRCQASDDLAIPRSLQLLRYRTEAEHPLHAFGPGSRKTLLPKGNGPKARCCKQWSWRCFLKWLPVGVFFHCEQPSTTKRFFWPKWVGHLWFFCPSQPDLNQAHNLPQELDRLARLSQELFKKMLAEQSTLAIVSNVPTTQLEQVVGRVFGSLSKHPPGDLHPSPTRLLAMADPLPGKTAVPPCLVESRDNPQISFTWSVPFQDSGGWVAHIVVFDSRNSKISRPWRYTSIFCNAPQSLHHPRSWLNQFPMLHQPLWFR